MLKDILSITKKEGLHKLISKAPNALIVESLIDGKRSAAYSSNTVISLGDISVYADGEDVPLNEVFKRIHTKENGKLTISHKEESAKISAYFEDVLPEYDKTRVYMSDLKKILQWYNILNEKNLLDFTEEEEEKKDEEKKEPEKNEKPVKSEKPLKNEKKLDVRSERPIKGGAERKKSEPKKGAPKKV
ncbi:hypothetical protein FACS1894199_11890 [Bacteroidia bacterium]|nr:hypothetical protein FACS1894199_11890 [Bacteroidia bacterium]